MSISKPKQKRQMPGNERPLYGTIVAERVNEHAFSEWKRRKSIYDCFLNGAAKHLIDSRFRPWKDKSLSSKLRYRLFKKHYKLYYFAKKVMKAALNEIVFYKKYDGEQLVLAFACVLNAFNAPSSLNTIEEEETDRDTAVQGKAAVGDDDDKNEDDETPAVDDEQAEDERGEGVTGVVENVINYGDNNGDNSNWNHTDDSYDSDDVYETNMFPGYGRAGSGPTFTYPKKA